MITYKTNKIKNASAVQFHFGVVDTADLLDPSQLDLNTSMIFLDFVSHPMTSLLHIVLENG